MIWVLILQKERVEYWEKRALISSEELPCTFPKKKYSGFPIHFYCLEMERKNCEDERTIMNQPLQEMIRFMTI